MINSNGQEPRRAEPAIVTEIVFPQDTNPHGVMFGGTAYAMMDKAAFLAASRFAHTGAVTASSESVDFTVPIRQGMIVEAVARVIHTGRTSMIVRVELYCQDPRETEMQLATVGYFTIVAVDDAGKPTPIPPLLVEGDVAEAEWRLGEAIRATAQARRQGYRAASNK